MTNGRMKCSTKFHMKPKITIWRHLTYMGTLVLTRLSKKDFHRTKHLLQSVTKLTFDCLCPRHAEQQRSPKRHWKSQTTHNFQTTTRNLQSFPVGKSVEKPHGVTSTAGNSFHIQRSQHFNFTKCSPCSYNKKAYKNSTNITRSKSHTILKGKSHTIQDLCTSKIVDLVQERRLHKTGYC